MKKKEYIIPEIHVVLLHMQQHLLAGSGEGVYDTPVSGDTQLSRMDEDFDKTWISMRIWTTKSDLTL